METFQWLGILGLGVVATAAALHALLHKREPSVAFGWIAVCLLFPAVGPILYYLLGINRIRTRAQALRGQQPPQSGGDPAKDVGEVNRSFAQQVRISNAVTGLPLTSGNTFEALHDGENAYPPMLAAIEAAEESVYLSTYIFESNRTGQRFADALGRAAQRGVDARVLLDGAGEWYSLPRIRHRLAREGVTVARFLPPRLLPPRLLTNLRNHRKILVVDGVDAFTGGMNIGDRHLVDRSDGREGVRDMHFRVSGPIAQQIESVFLDDWAFTSGDETRPVRPLLPATGEAAARTILDGPNEDLRRLVMVLVGAAAAARRRIQIMTPYFLPPRELIAALQAAAIRGIEVDIVLPANNNLPFMHWATRNMLWELLKWGVRVYYQPGPFTHTKLFVVDDHYAQIGSANLDPRSLRLNFELVVEVYEPTFAGTLAAHIDAQRDRSESVAQADIDNRPYLARVRDAVCWLFTPYL